MIKLGQKYKNKPLQRFTENKEIVRSAHMTYICMYIHTHTHMQLVSAPFHSR